MFLQYLWGIETLLLDHSQLALEGFYSTYEELKLGMKGKANKGK